MYNSIVLPEVVDSFYFNSVLLLGKKRKKKIMTYTFIAFYSIRETKKMYSNVIAMYVQILTLVPTIHQKANIDRYIS